MNMKLVVLALIGALFLALPAHAAPHRYGSMIHNFDATTNPGVTDDISAGYTVGSRWINTTAGTIWNCVDNTNGAAVWKKVEPVVPGITHGAGTAGDYLTTFTAQGTSGEIWQALNANSNQVAFLNTTASEEPVFSLIEDGGTTYLSASPATGLVLYENASAPATPPTGSVTIYKLTDDHLYLKNDAGTQTQLDGGGGASQLSDLSDVTSAATTNRYALLANGSAYVGRALTVADISDIGANYYTETEVDAICNWRSPPATRAGRSVPPATPTTTWTPSVDRVRRCPGYHHRAAVDHGKRSRRRRLGQRREAAHGHGERGHGHAGPQRLQPTDGRPVSTPDYRQRRDARLPDMDGRQRDDLAPDQ